MSLKSILTVPLSKMTDETRSQLQELVEEYPLAIRVSDESVLIDMEHYRNLGLEVPQVNDLVDDEDKYVDYLFFDEGQDI